MTVAAHAQERLDDDRLPTSGHNLLLDAKVSGNLRAFDEGLRGAPDHILYDLDGQRFLRPSEWHEYGIGYGRNLGVVPEDRPAYWMAEWQTEVEANLIVLTGAYPNQPQPKTAWKIEVRNSGNWTVHDRGVGGWYDHGRYIWGGDDQKPIRFDGMRVSLFSEDNKTPLKSIHFRGEDQVSWLVCNTQASPEALVTSPRVTRDLEVLYTFADGAGDVVQDRSSTGEPLNLKIEKPSAVQWRDGALVVRSPTTIVSTASASKLTESVRHSGSLSIEAWLKPKNNQQKGPARIISLSAGASQRNFTLGQERGQYDVRLRTTSTNDNGIPSTSTPKRSAKPRLTHVVFTRDAKGNTRFFINGKLQSTKPSDGKLSNWSDTFQLSLANETSGDRPWLGELYLVAIYSRDLTPEEVALNFKAGDGSAEPPASLVERKVDPKAEHFELNIAPLFANHCLECHDSSTSEGGLDLSRKDAALAGGESGKVIQPEDSSQSLLWEAVESDSMPSDRPPLSDLEKDLLRRWIDDGATWSLTRIDPAIYVHEGSHRQNWIRRLTVAEYVETVRSAVGVDIEREARELLPPDLRADGFSNTAYNLNVDLKHVEAYSRLATIIVERMDVLEFAARFSKKRSLNTDASTRNFVAAMGKWLFRGPLEQREEVNYSGIATTVASAGGSYEEGVSLIVEAMLQSPRFIYRVESQRGDGASLPVSDYELASRLSYIIWGGPPDQQLAQAADEGRLDRDGVRSQVARMLEDHKAVKRSRQFADEWLDLGRLDNLQPNTEKFSDWDPQLAGDMRDETLAVFEDVVWKQERPISDMMNVQWTYATPRLASHYGLELQGDGLTRYDLSDVPGRGGLLTHGSLLTVGGDEASMVSRGLFVLHDVLRGVVKSPPPCVDTTPIPTKTGLTQRGIAEARLANVACGGCHAKFEPLAFGLEKFDGLGAFHEQDEHGNKLREDGQILIPGEAQPVPYQTSAELMDLLANSDRVRESITWKLTQFALGRPLVASDARIVNEIHESAQQNGGTYASLITAIIMSDLVQTTQSEAIGNE